MTSQFPVTFESLAATLPGSAGRQRPAWTCRSGRGGAGWRGPLCAPVADCTPAPHRGPWDCVLCPWEEFQGQPQHGQGRPP